METLELLKQRTSTNKFDTTKKLSQKEIRELVALATEAPSAFNIQHWRFVAVTDQADKERLKAVAFGQHQAADAAVVFIVLGDLRGHEKLPDILSRGIKAGILNQEVANGWVSSVNGLYADERAARDEAVRSATLAAMTLMIAAQAKGLA